MYESYFNLKMKPFELLPNPELIYMSKAHKRAISYLDYGISERAGFILLTGEVGSGKTTIIRNLVKKNLHNLVLSKVFNTNVNSDQLIAMINDDFGLPVQNKDKITMLKELNDFLIDQFRKGNQPVLIIDEAQNLPLDLLEEIRMLSNLETDSAKLLQIILVGQPELRNTLASASLMQLRQRISVNCHIQPLTIIETEEYIMYRLEKAGGRDAVTFSENTIDVIFKYSRGIPRLINIICDFLLLSAYAEQTTVINSEMVRDITGDLDFDNHFWGSVPASSPAEPPAVNNSSVEIKFGEQMHKIISDINERLDRLGVKSDMLNRKIYSDLAGKITCLDHSLKSHKEATGSVISDLIKKISRTDSSELVEVPCSFAATGAKNVSIKQAINS